MSKMAVDPALTSADPALTTADPAIFKIK